MRARRCLKGSRIREPPTAEHTGPARLVGERPQFSRDCLGKGFSNAKCHQDEPPDSRCTSGCSDCTNPGCPFPRGHINESSNQVQFGNLQGKIVCNECWTYHYKHRCLRSEALLSASRSVNLVQLVLVVRRTQFGSRTGSRRSKIVIMAPTTRVRVLGVTCLIISPLVLTAVI